MATDKLATIDQGGILEKVVIEGDLSKLSPGDRVLYYRNVCQSIGVNPFTKPFSYLYLNNKLVLYANRDCTDQLRSSRKISITKLERERLDDVYVVTAYAQDGNRTDSSIGAVSISGLKGDALANAMMKAETKSKRRVTLSIVGLGWLDETEIETIKDARPANINVETGEVETPRATPRATVVAENAPVDEEPPVEGYEDAMGAVTPNTPPPARGIPTCPEHHKSSPGRNGGFYCPTKLADGKWCPWRSD